MGNVVNLSCEQLYRKRWPVVRNIVCKIGVLYADILMESMVVPDDQGLSWIQQIDPWYNAVTTHLNNKIVENKKNGGSGDLYSCCLSLFADRQDFHQSLWGEKEAILAYPTPAAIIFTLVNRCCWRQQQTKPTRENVWRRIDKIRHQIQKDWAAQTDGEYLGGGQLMSMVLQALKEQNVPHRPKTVKTLYTYFLEFDDECVGNAFSLEDAHVSTKEQYGVVDAEQRLLLRECIEQLPLKYKIALKIKYPRIFKEAEMTIDTEDHDMATNTVKVYYHKAVVQLKECMNL